MNFLFLNQYGPPDPSPTARLLGDLATYLRKQGHSVMIVSDQQHYLARPTRGLRRLLRECRALFMMLFRGLRTQPKPDVVLCLTSPACLLPLSALIAIKHRAGLAHWAMDLYPELATALGEIRNGRSSHLATKLMNWGYHRADLVVALDTDMAQHLSYTYQVDARILPPWPARISPDKNTLLSKQSPGSLLAAAQWTWLYSGNLGRAHEWRSILDVQSELERRELPIQLLFEGGGAAWNEAKSFGEAIGLRNCLWTGYVSEAESFQTLRASKLIVATQRRIAKGLLWPSKLARILPLTKPLLWIGPSEGGIAESLKDRPFSKAFESADVLDMAEWIQMLWQRRELLPKQESDERADQIYLTKATESCGKLCGWFESI